MQPLIWQDSDSVGVKELDDQHKEIFSIGNHLYDLVSRSETKENIESVLNDLSKSVFHHFSTEEKYFDLYQYDQKILHTKLHQAYAQKMDQFSEQIKQNFSLDLMNEIINFTKSWWINHIDNEDKKYSKYFNQKGLF